MMVCAAISTASMLMPARRLATLTLEQTRLVLASAWDGLDDAAVGVADALLDECGRSRPGNRYRASLPRESRACAIGEVLILAARGYLRHRG